MNAMDATGFSQGAVAFAGYVLVVLAGLRLLKTDPVLLAVTAAFVVCVAAVPLLALLGGFNFWIFLATYWFLATGFLMAFGAVYKSLSLRILSDLSSRPQRSDDYSAIFSRYLVQDSYQNRLQVICDKGLVTLSDGRHALTGKGRALAARVQRIQLIFGITRSG